MAKFDNTKQQMIAMNGIRQEVGSVVIIASVSSQTFTIATKLRKVKAGFGAMTTDGLTALVTVGPVTAGQVTFTRVGSISTSADTISYVLFGY